MGYVSLRDLCELLSPGGAETMAPSQDSRAPLEFGGPLGNGAVGGLRDRDSARGAAGASYKLGSGQDLRMEGFEGYPEAGAAGVCWGVSGEGPAVGLQCGDLWSGGLDGVAGPEGGSSRGARDEDNMEVRDQG